MEKELEAEFEKLAKEASEAAKTMRDRLNTLRRMIDEHNNDLCGGAGYDEYLHLQDLDAMNELYGVIDDMGWSSSSLDC